MASDRGYKSDPLKNVSLLKLHGSLNWWVRSANSKLSDVFSKKPAAVTPVLSKN